MSLQRKVICSAQIVFDVAALQRNNVSTEMFLTFATKFREVDVTVAYDKVTAVADSLPTLLEFERKCQDMIEMARNTPSSSDPYLPQDESLLGNADNEPTTSGVHDIGAVGVDADTSSLEWVITPFPQPRNGYTVSENASGSIKRKFCFPEGQMDVSGNVIKYSFYECVINLPLNSTGLEVDALLKEAFLRRKLFYVGRDTHGPGFAVQSAYHLLPSSTSEQTVSGNKLVQMRTKLHDLGIEVSESLSPTISTGAIVPEPRKRQKEPEIQPAVMSISEKPLKSSSVHENTSLINKSSRFPQPDGLVLNCEFHKKDLRGFEGFGAIHMYFRFDGGRVSNEIGETTQYPSYIKTACLPANIQGRQLYEMIERAAKSKKLFVVAYKYGEFKLRSKVCLLNSNDYPQDKYLEQLLQEMQKLEIQPLTYIPSLPVAVQAHHGESSDDEKEEERLEVLKKGGPFEQPEKGMMKLEKDLRTLRGFTACGAIMVYVRFAGGKMKIKGYKPSNSFEIRYSQTSIVAALPGNDEGKRIVTMLQIAYQRRQLFTVEKRVGEPSFRVRPKVHLITTEEYPKSGYLMQLKQQLLNLGIPEPSETEVANVLLHDSISTQRIGSVSPFSSITPTNDRLKIPVINPHQPAIRRNTGARPKQRISEVLHGTARIAESASNPAKPNNTDEDKCPICLGSLSQMPCKKLGCGHEFHQACVDMALKSQPNNCPYCKQPVNTSNPSSAQIGIQAPHMTTVRPTPLHRNRQTYVTNNTNIKVPGIMSSSIDNRSLPGFDGCGTIVISYNIPPGIQQDGHSNPGQRYNGTNRHAYLPDNPEGRDLLRLLQQAFDGGLIFTVGRSQTTGRDNQVIWNGIPHKTNINGGKQSFGYPDKDYLNELRQSLYSKGIQ